jgi:hypothetical protein
MHPIVWRIDYSSFEMADQVAHARRHSRKVVTQVDRRHPPANWHFLRGGPKILLALPLALSHFDPIYLE